MKWYIPDCFWHSKSNGVFVSHEAVCILNTNKEAADIKLTLYFEDRDPISDYNISVPGERTKHIRLDQTTNNDGVAIPQDTPYAMVIECDQNITVQYTRVDTSQPELAIATTII